MSEVDRRGRWIIYTLCCFFFRLIDVYYSSDDTKERRASYSSRMTLGGGRGVGRWERVGREGWAGRFLLLTRRAGKVARFIPRNAVHIDVVIHSTEDFERERGEEGGRGGTREYPRASLRLLPASLVPYRIAPPPPSFKGGELFPPSSEHTPGGGSRVHVCRNERVLGLGLWSVGRGPCEGRGDCVGRR